MSRSRRPRYVVVVYQEEGVVRVEVVGTFTHKARAQVEADRWTDPETGYMGEVQDLWTGPELRRHLNI